MSEAGESSNLVSFKKVSKFTKVRRGIVSRKRKGSDSSSGSGSGAETAVVTASRKAKRNPFVVSSSNRKLIEAASSSDEESAERAGLIAGAYASNKDAPAGPADQGATAVNETETGEADDAQAQFERTQAVLKDRAAGKEDDKVYRGLSTYGAKIKKDTAAGNAANGFVRKGPIRAPANVRMSVRWDYAPDLCKDYKETGFCTFGDSCKFLHDRTDYKHGWELERDWEAGRYGKDDEDPNKYLIQDDEDELPFKCFLCRESFTEPVVTKCGHYFCEACALANFKKNHKCYVCDKPTGGMFAPAKELAARIAGDKTKKGKRDADAKAAEAAAEISDDEAVKPEEGDMADDEETPMERLPDPVASDEEGEEGDDE